MIRNRAARRTILAAFTSILLAIAPPVASHAQDCFHAYFEIARSLPLTSDEGWNVPTPPNDTWYEIYPNPGVPHPQDHYLDHGLDGVVSKDDEIIEVGVLPSWSVAWVGTILRITRVDVYVSPPAPLGPMLTTWWPDFVYRCPDGNCPDPDTLTVLQPDFGALIDIDAHAGPWTHPFPVAVGDFLVDYDENWEEIWYVVNAIDCGVIVAPDLATPAVEQTWGAMKRRYR